jgi:AGZA family xanthine/uracil permease-like MFS transporter
MILSIFKFREALVNKIPKNLKLGITAGIGLFITIIALLNSQVIVSSPATTVALGDLGSAPVILSIVGLLIIGILQYKKVPGGILIGILGTWVIGIIVQLIGWAFDVNIFSTVLYPTLSVDAIKANFAAPAMFKFDFGFVAKNLASFAIITFTFLYTDIFDTVGTLIGVAQKGNLLDQDGKLPKAGGALMADAVGTVVGACLGTSTVTSYVESSAGVAAGGKTGLTALTTGIMFIIAIIFAPIFLAIPSFATTPAMLYVGLLMLSAIKQMDFEGDIADVIGGFLAVIMMPFAYSIATGIMFGIISWVILKVCIGKIKDVSAIMWVSFVLFAIYIATLVM